MRWIALAAVFGAFVLVAAGCLGGNTRSFRVPSSGMEPTIRCAKPAVGCTGTADDHVIVQVGKRVKRGDIVAFDTPPKATNACGAGGIFLKRIVGLPRETIAEDGKRLHEPYISARARALDTFFHEKHWKVPAGDYFVLGDNRSESCDSRYWGGVPRHNVIGPVVKINRG
jgi:signal peptidase I